ncbi:hypothetical protein [Duganella vulcania]|uniref:Uncharacterized protein n=1 Tax=Duganella vulcania TaxID=2692166 RepID=A0A845GSM9_9BURK|nr:hypothetical protein [Duganella vulcania]MYM96236.1 hypothetical protein [Duganella vulcania]
MTLSPSFPIKLALVGAVLAGAAFFLFKKSGGGNLAQTVAQNVGAVVVDVADGVTSGVVYGVGDKLGVPRTDQTECEKALAEGRTWDASFACPAGTFIKSFF